MCVEETGEQVCGHAAAILSRRANVVDRRDFGDERGLRVGHRTARGENGFGLRQAHHGRRHAAERDSRPIAGDPGHHDFRDRLRGARADLPEPLPAANRVDFDRRDDFIGPGQRLAIPGVEAREGHAARRRPRSAARPPPRPPRARATCRRPATRWRCCPRACRGSGSARRPTSRAAATSIGSRRFTSGERMRSVYVASAPIDMHRCRAARIVRSASSPQRFRNRVPCSVPKLSDTYRSVQPAIGTIGPSSRSIFNASASERGSSS